MVMWFTSNKKFVLRVADVLKIPVDISVAFHDTDFSTFQPVGCKD